MPVHLVTLAFNTEAVEPASIATVSDETALGDFLRRVAVNPVWTWTHVGLDALALIAEPHLLQRVDANSSFRVLARYLFDDFHAAAHPEVLDTEHLSLLHGSLAAKLMDDGVIALEPDSIAASLRWVATERRGVRLQRDGGRIKRRRHG